MPDAACAVDDDAGPAALVVESVGALDVLVLPAEEEVVEACVRGEPDVVLDVQAHNARHSATPRAESRATEVMAIPGVEAELR